MGRIGGLAETTNKKSAKTVGANLNAASRDVGGGRRPWGEEG
ncbi:hypothetical protein E2C01_064598 [Portunus trituberculatus]|uniref:Uncharacterized protein n=1 Tax=Portunus trituberculatus TaxID=210409 RepID=A0A5B7HP82_PORTR|nr:hypothetical protein [Portunus trituberculatus]